MEKQQYIKITSTILCMVMCAFSIAFALYDQYLLAFVFWLLGIGYGVRVLIACKIF